MSGSDASPPLSLEETYQWFQGELLRRNDARHREPAPDAPLVDSVLTPSGTLTSEERLGVYVESYFLRLRDVLASDFVAVRAWLGPAEFGDMARSYLSRFPSRHYSLNFLGDRLPAYLERHGAEDGVREIDLLADLARIENAMARLIDDEETPSLPADAFLGLPPDRWGEMRLRPIAALRLFALDHRVNRLITESRGDGLGDLPALERVPTWIAVYRLEFRVIRLDLSRFEHDLLASLSEGSTVLAAIERAAASYEGDEHELGDVVFRSFSRLAREGLFTAIN